MLELEEEMENIGMDINRITDNLDSLDNTLEFINKKINTLTEEIMANDLENIEPLSFSGLKSVDAAKVTL